MFPEFCVFMFVLDNSCCVAVMLVRIMEFVLRIIGLERNGGGFAASVSVGVAGFVG